MTDKQYDELKAELASIRRYLQEVMDFYVNGKGEPSKRLMTADEVAERFGVSVDTIRQHAASRKIRFYKIGNRMRFSEEQVAEYLNAREVVKEPPKQRLAPYLGRHFRR